VCRRSERRSGLWEFASVVATVAEQEVAEGLQRHGMCPPLLKAWLAKDIVQVGSCAHG
jgi:aerobic-type carbon monoxide dehydrogenase small subunit (CoxS/CutS family)